MDLKMSKVVILLILLQSAACIKFHIMTSLRSDCPGELAGEPCLTLQQYVSYPSSDSNVILEFEWGNHSLKSSFTISGGTYFGLVAVTNATINCDGLSSAYIRFSSTRNADIKGISFIRCGRVEFRSVTNGTIAMSNFQMSMGTQALYLYYSSYVTIINSNFNDNHGSGSGSAIYSNQVSSLAIIQTVFSNNTAHQGGALYFYVRISIPTYLSVEGCSFFNNRAGNGYGGAIYATNRYGYRSTVITSIRSIFENCSAYQGGGVFYITYASMITINESTFTNNRAINNHGGILYVSSSSRVDSNGNTFMNNTARYNGGALYMSSVSAIVNTWSRFVNNAAVQYGGAVYVSGSSSTTNSGNSFINNRAINYGGALYISGSSTNNGNTFINNTANAGGAIYASGSIIDTRNLFSSNRANNNGGALCVSGSYRSVVTEGSSFINNRVRGGGGGGALSVLDTQAILRLNGSSFINNIITGSDGKGGAVYVAQANVQSINVNNSIFVNNSATNGTGGAIYTKRGFIVTNTIFGYNRAPLCAAVSIEQSSSIRSMIFMETTFLHNTAVGSTVRGNVGGVGCVRNADISIFSCTFSHNLAMGGGGVFDIEDSTITIESSTFKNNTAGVDGGVFYTHAFPSSYIINENIFMNNRAGDDGGVFYLGRSGSLVHVYGSSFTANTAGDRGGVMALFGSAINISDTNMQNNMARSGDDISACTSDNTNNILISLNERIDPQHAVCTLYDGSLQVIPEPFPHDNSNFDISVYFQAFISVQDEQIIPVMALTDPSTTTGSEVDPILKEIQSRLLGTSVVVYLLFIFFTVFVVVLIVMMVVKCKAKKAMQQQTTVNRIMDTQMTTPEQYTESIDLYEEPEWCVQGQSNTIPMKSNAGYVNKRTQHYVK